MRPDIYQQNQFLQAAYLGKGGVAIRGFLDRAYLDMNRRAPGIGKIENVTVVRRQAAGLLANALEDSKTKMNSPTQSDFDHLHRQVCEKLVTHCRISNYGGFGIGHAQKWVNMTFKYLFCFGQSLPEDIPN